MHSRSSAAQAAAYPQYYDQRKGGCALPTMTFGPHAAAGDPTPVDTITFQFQDAAGATVTKWTPGERYSVEVQSYSEAPVLLWLHASGGAHTDPAELVHTPSRDDTRAALHCSR